MKIERVILREIQLPLVNYFETSFGRTDERRILLLELKSEGLSAWGECTAPETPYFSYETIDTAWSIMERFLAPLLLAGSIEHPSHLPDGWDRIRGHNMAKGAVEAALWDLQARRESRPLWRVIGGTRQRIDCGVSLGIQGSLEALLARIESELSQGYRKIKVKIKPGWDLRIIEGVRQRYPQTPLMADANSAYHTRDTPLLSRLDDFDLMMIEQPLRWDDLVDHAELQSRLRTPICLDESIHSYFDARAALLLGSARIINIKLGRVGGFGQARRIHDLCLAQGIPVWCGGMLESGIGRAHNIALSTLPGFTIPGDVSASRRYFHKDTILPEVEVTPEGQIRAPDGPGIGVEPDLAFLERKTVRTSEFGL